MALTLLTLAHRRVSLGRGEALHRAGDAFQSLYVVASGALKSRCVLEDGRDQVVAFHLPGDVVGLDGLGTGRHHSDVTALQKAQAWVVPLARLDDHAMREQLPGLLAQELRRSRATLSTLGTRRALGRIAAFLVELARRQGNAGRPARMVTLAMSREEMGSHLGLTLETVSRALSRLRRDGLVHVGARRVRILDFERLASARDAA